MISHSNGRSWKLWKLWTIEVDDPKSKWWFSPLLSKRWWFSHSP
jgi:hypothetical protein